MLTREHLLAPGSIRSERLSIGDDFVRVREMLPLERDDYMNTVLKTDDEMTLTPGIQVKLVRMCTVDDDMNQVFAADDEANIERMSGSVVQAIALRALYLSGLTSVSVEDTKKNSEHTLNAEPGSELQKLSVAQ